MRRGTTAILALLLGTLSVSFGKTRVLILTGGHAYDTTAFNAMWKSFPDMECTQRSLAFGHEVFEDVSAFPYDVVVFYNHQDPGDRMTAKHKANFHTLLDRGVGMFVFHHAVAAYPFFPDYEAMAGVKYRSASFFKDSVSTYKEGVDITCDLAEKTHPLAAGAPASFTVHDEMYFNMAYGAENRVLLSTTYPGAAGPLAWTRKAGNSRVFATALGHGSTIFANPDFRNLVARSVAWLQPCAANDARAVCAAVPALPKRVLIFHKQNGFIHTATDTCVAVLKANLAAQKIPSEDSEDSLDFTSSNLARFGVVVFYNTNYRNGPLLTRAQEAAFEDYIHKGGGFVGIHSAVPLNGVAEEAIWPWYARLFGARFRSHAPMRTADMIIQDKTHPSTRGLPDRIPLQDEWYAVQANPREEAGLKVVATVDETGFLAASSMGDHPVSWYRVFEGGRSFMTLIGHDMASFGEADFLRHVTGGIKWAGGWEEVTGVFHNRTVGQSRSATGEVRASAGGPLVYRGRDGMILEIHSVDGRFIEARRHAPGVK